MYTGYATKAIINCSLQKIDLFGGAIIGLLLSYFLNTTIPLSLNTHNLNSKSYGAASILPSAMSLKFFLKSIIVVPQPFVRQDLIDSNSRA